MDSSRASRSSWCTYPYASQAHHALGEPGTGVHVHLNTSCFSSELGDFSVRTIVSEY
jgi:hypothetical protein